jgi:IS30 family transposase
MAQRDKPCKLSMNRRLRDLVAEKLRHDRSPGQINGWLEATYPGVESMNVSHEVIYRTLRSYPGTVG